jgi:hypothetical protein
LHEVYLFLEYLFYAICFRHHFRNKGFIMSKFILLFGLALAASIPSVGNAAVYEIYRDSELLDLIGEIEIIQGVNDEKKWCLIKKKYFGAMPESAADLLLKAEGLHFKEDPDSNSTSYIFVFNDDKTTSQKISTKLKITISDIDGNTCATKKLFIEFHQFEKSSSFFHFHNFYLIDNEIPGHISNS